MPELWLVLPGLFLWSVILLLPWRPWGTRETLDANTLTADLSDITVLIPARNEEETIRATLLGLSIQGNINKIILLNDDSEDETVANALSLSLQNLEIINVDPLPSGWSGKLWALEMGRKYVSSDCTLLLDADIELLPGTLTALYQKMKQHDLQLVSLMATLRMDSVWEKIMMPSFIYFFKLLYPFAISNSSSKMISAAAGGCILIDTTALNDIGGFQSLRDELIDDCALAKKIKNNAGKTWIGLTHSAISNRAYVSLKPIWEMVSRTAFTQLGYSPLLLLLCTTLLTMAFLLPFSGLFLGSPVYFTLTVLSLLMMSGTYWPLIRYYKLSPVWLLCLPVAAVLYLLIIWDSAINHWQGISATWKERRYKRTQQKI
jgi:hopene-associated glycosyltransferase HpnB